MTNSATSTRKDGVETRERLINAAERLIVKHGVENLKMADVNRAAKQKNRNAAQYHFGDRMGLIHAVLDNHTRQIALERRARLDHLAEREPSLRELVEILVLPVVNHVRTDPNGRAFLRINRYMLSEHIELGWQRSNSMPEVQELQQRIRTQLRPHKREAMQAKMLLLQCMLFNGLDSFHDLNQPREENVFVDTLCDGIEAVLLS